MVFRILKNSFSKQKKAMAVMVISVAFGTALVASLLTISFEIGGKVAKELRAFGANIIVEPKVEGIAGLSGQQRYLREADIQRIKTIFWRHNIIGMAPFLETRVKLKNNPGAKDTALIGTWFEKELPLPGEAKTFAAGVKTVSPWWDIQGAFPKDNLSVLAGSSIAERMKIKKGDTVTIGNSLFLVSGILTTGGVEDEQVFALLSAVQEMQGLTGKVSRILVSALTTPMDSFAYKDPLTMTKTEYEKWYCTGYVTSIAKQVEEVTAGSKAKPVWQVAETEGKVLKRLNLAIYLLCLISIVSSAIGVATTMVTSLLRRVEEIGLMKAMGADNLKIIFLFLSEGAVIGTGGGLVGLLLSYFASRYIGLKVFDAVLTQTSILIPLSLGSALLISVTGTLLPIIRALKIKPAVVLKGAE